MVWSCPSPAGNRIKPPRSSSKGVQAYLASQTSPSTLGSVLAQARLHRNRFPRHSLIQSGDSSGKLQVSVPGWEWWCCSLIFDAPCDVFVKWPFMFEHVLLCAIEKSPSQSMEHLSTTKQFTQTKFPNWWSALNPGFPHHEHTTQYIFAICWGCHSLWGVSGTAMSNRGIESWMEVYRNHPHPRAPLFLLRVKAPRNDR